MLNPVTIEVVDEITEDGVRQDYCIHTKSSRIEIRKGAPVESILEAGRRFEQEMMPTRIPLATFSLP